MPLRSLTPVAFIPTANAARAREFYEQTLGLSFLKDDDFALVFELGPTRQMLRIARTPDFTPFPFTILGWQVDDIHTHVRELAAKGIDFLRIPYFPQDADGIWTAPDGAQVAWFKDPDGNTLSLSRHP